MTPAPRVATRPLRPLPEEAARLAWVDVAKGLCIILVVMMHSTLGTGEALGGEGVLHDVVEFARPFRIPDFFLLSGLFLGRVIDRDEEQVVLPGEVPGRRLGDLCGRREVDEAVLMIDRGAREPARGLGLAPQRARTDLVDERHRSSPETTLR